MILWIIMIIIGFALLIKGADLLVDGASNIAKKFHIPEIIIGLTVVSIGTSMPELFVSITSAIEGYPDMSIGNVIGSNIANLLLVLGVSAILKPVKFKKETRLIEIPICVGVSLIFAFFTNLGRDITRLEAGVLLFLFVCFIIYTIIMAKKGEEFDEVTDSNEIDEKKLNNNIEKINEIKSKEKKKNKSELKNSKIKNSTLLDVIFVVLGAVMLKFGGDFAVNNSVKIADFLGLSEKLISVTILALGTSLPELVTSISAARKGNSDIAIGNILGSNVFNMLLIIGISAMIKPITYNVEYNVDMIFMIAATVVLAMFPVIKPRNKMSRNNGIIYFLMYIAYMCVVFGRQI